MRQDRRASQREIEFINEMVSPLSCGDEEDDEDDENEDEEEEEPQKDEDDDDDDDDEEEEEPIWTATEWDRGATCWRKV